MCIGPMWRLPTLLSFTVPRIAGLPVLIVVAYRPSDLLLSQHPLRPVLLEMTAHGMLREISLTLLSAQDIEAYLALQFPAHAFPADLAPILESRTEGCPLFLVELLADLRSQNTIREDDGCWRIDASPTAWMFTLPVSVRAMIDRRMERLGESDRQLLGTAGLQGISFHTLVVAEALELPTELVEARCSQFERAHGFLRLEGEEVLPDGALTMRYRFAHALYHEAFIGRILLTDRVARSRAIGWSMARHFEGEESTVAAQLAGVFEAGREFEQASNFWLLAARNAARAHAGATAMDLVTRAIDCAAGRQPQLLAASLVQAELLQSAGRHSDAAASFAKVAGLAHDAQSVEAEVEALCGAANSCFWIHRQQETRRYATQARTAARHAGLEQGELRLT